jgi:hypothetical protein
MNDEVEMLAKRLRDNADRPMSAIDLANEFGLSNTKLARDVKTLLKYDGFFDLGNNMLMFTGNADMAAFEIFRFVAPHISFNEYLQNRERPHVLMRLSRDREVAYRADTEKMLQDAVKEREKRGNSVF